MTFRKRQNYSDNKKINGHQRRGVEEEEMNIQNTEEFSNTENTLYDIIMTDICHNSFVQIVRVNP